MKSSTQLFRPRCQRHLKSVSTSPYRSSSLPRYHLDPTNVDGECLPSGQLSNCSTSRNLSSKFFNDLVKHASCQSLSPNYCRHLSSSQMNSSYLSPLLSSSSVFSKNYLLTNPNSRTRSGSGSGRFFCSNNNQRKKIKDVIRSSSFAALSSSSSSSSSESESDSNTPFSYTSTFFTTPTPGSYNPTHSSSSNPLLITIKLSISFSNGYFSLRFAHRECLFHFWSPIELVLKMFQEELASATGDSTRPTATKKRSSSVPPSTTKPMTSSSPITLMSPDVNLGRARLAATHNLEIADPLDDENTDGAGLGFLEQLDIEFIQPQTISGQASQPETTANHPEESSIKFDHIKFGRIEMVAEHQDPDTTSSDSDCLTCQENESSVHPELQSSSSSDSPIGCRHRYRLARLMPFGYALLGCDLDEVYFVGTGTGKTVVEGPDGHCPRVTRPLRINFKMVDKTKTLKNDIDVWHQRNPLDSQTMLFKTKTIDPNLFEQNELVVRLLDYSKLCSIMIDDDVDIYGRTTGSNNPTKNKFIKTKILVRKTLLHQFLQQERELLIERFNPMQQEFAQLIQSARKESRRKFKFGGLFLLSAQLGFVGRLTYFEYSWDIMEPVTWIMTYTTMVGSFAYYIITSEEYVVPMVEKRMIASRFWKLAQSRQFDVQQYKQLKEELKQLDKRIGKLRAGF